jgi:hypothetical protein
MEDYFGQILQLVTSKQTTRSDLSVLNGLYRSKISNACILYVMFTPYVFSHKVTSAILVYIITVVM